jgi:hypothetical protein
MATAKPSTERRNPMGDNSGRDPITSLIYLIGRAAQAGWAQTARVITLLAVAAAAVSLILTTSR